MTKEIIVVDEVMGGGKTTAMLNFINEHPDRKFIYITPYLSEYDRVKSHCPAANFATPIKEKGSTKLGDIKRLMCDGRNIVSTHALFRLFDLEAMDICRSQDYTLILDEAMSVLEDYERLSPWDKDTLFKEFVDVGEDKRLRWRECEVEYKGRFYEEKRLCETGSLEQYHKGRLIWTFPIDAFLIFEEVYVLTYMFSAQIQRYYYDLFDVKYRYMYVEGNSPQEYRLTDSPVKQGGGQDYSKLIHIFDKDKMNSIGDRKHDMSKGWYIRNRGNKAVFNRLRNNMSNYLRNITHAKSNDIIWTTFKNFRTELEGRGYVKAFIPSNARATNEFRNRHHIIYPINKYPNTTVKAYFASHGIKIDEDAYALSEMLQFIWRSAVRCGEEIWVYIPSRRMRDLLQGWIRENSKE